MQHLNKENYNTENADAKQPDLISLRGRIDEIDREIVRLYEERMQVTDEVGEYKIRTGRKVYDKDREKAKIEKVRELAHSEFTRKGVTELFSQLMSMSRKRQFAMLEKAGVHGRLPFIEIEDLEDKIIEVEAEIKNILDTNPYLYKWLLKDDTATKRRKQEYLDEIADYEIYSTQLDEVLGMFKIERKLS